MSQQREGRKRNKKELKFKRCSGRYQEGEGAITVGRNLHMSAKIGFQVEGVMSTGSSNSKLFFIDCLTHLPSNCLSYACPLTSAMCIGDEHQRGLCCWAIIIHSNNCFTSEQLEVF